MKFDPRGKYTTHALGHIPRIVWVRAMLALEDEDKPITGGNVGARLEVFPHHARRMIHDLRQAHVLRGDGPTLRVAAIGRWAAERPTLCYFATTLDPADPVASSAAAAATALNISTAIGLPLVSFMPPAPLIAKAASGDRMAVDAMSHMATRADVVMVVGTDPLLEVRSDVVAARRADVLTIVDHDEDPMAALLAALTIEMKNLHTWFDCSPDGEGIS